MAEKKQTTKMLTIGLVIVIAIATIVMIYVNLPKETIDDETKDDQINDNEIEKPTVQLNVTYNNTEYTYNFTNIENLESTTGTARYLKASPFFKTGTIIISPEMNESAYQYTGVKISTLLQDIQNLPETYNVTLSAPDGYSTTLNNSEIAGNLVTYTENGNETDVEVSVILSYKKNGEYLPDDEATLRVAVVGDEPISLSNLWVSNVVNIEIS